MTANRTKFELKPMGRMAHTNGIDDLFAGGWIPKAMIQLIHERGVARQVAVK